MRGGLEAGARVDYVEEGGIDKRGVRVPISLRRLEKWAVIAFCCIEELVSPSREWVVSLLKGGSNMRLESAGRVLRTARVTIGL
jgi:hypothetical protein